MQATYAIPPVLLIHWRRPYLLSEQLERLKTSGVTKVYIFADGQPMVNDDAVSKTHAGILEAKQEHRHSGLDIEVKLADSNLGCRDGVRAAIDWFFEHTEEGVILEDDCMPGEEFVRFAAEMLDRFRDAPQIFSVTGENSAQLHFKDSYGFLAHPFIWGWATWKSRWSQHERSLESWLEIRNNAEEIKRVFPNLLMRRTWEERLDMLAYQSKPDTWDYQLTYDVRRRDLLTVVPARNLVTNVGFGPDGTHITKPGARTGLEAELIYPLSHPPHIRRERWLENEFFWRDEGRRHSYKTMFKSARRLGLFVKSTARIMAFRAETMKSRVQSWVSA